jgi:hypothetical protein
MTDLDDLKDAMESPPDFAPRSLDLGPVMAAGGRLRRRRRLATGAAGGVAVLALLVGGAQLVQRTDRPVPSGAAAPQVAAQPSAQPKGGALGDVISTGMAAKTGKWVFYAQAVDEKALPETHFGIMAGRRLPSGELTADVMANEAKGSDRSPGFHAVQGSMQIDAGKSPTFGYYVGPVARITAKAGGKTVAAKHAVWSEDPSVTVFWFDPAAGTPKDIRAYDKDGNRLPGGAAQVGVG